MPVRMTDTAGIRKPENLIEKEGLYLVREKLSSADVVVAVLDGSEALTNEDVKIIKENLKKKLLVVINKSDLSHVLNDKEIKHLLPEDGPPSLWISARTGEGISEMKGAIRSLVLTRPVQHPSDDMVTNIRHKTALEKTAILLSKARDCVLTGLSPELAAFDVRDALDCLGEITGKTLNEDVLDRIFSTFCLGK
jgi:tRNA modification GTPase